MENIYIVEKFQHELIMDEKLKEADRVMRRHIVLHKYFYNTVDLSEFIQTDINEEHISYFEELEDEYEELKHLLSHEDISLEIYLNKIGEGYWKLETGTKDLIGHKGEPLLWKRINFKHPMLENPMIIDYVVHEIPYGGH